LSGDVAASVGPNNYHRAVIAGSGTNGRLTYTGDAALTASDGERAHSRQRSLLAFARSTVATGSGEVVFSAMGLHNPLAQNPGALTLDELKSDARAADPLSVRRDARKSVQQLQLGSTYTRPLPHGRLSVAAFGGLRALENPLTFAVIDVNRSSYGASALFNRRTLLSGIQHSLTAGVDLQAQRDWRENHVTCIDTVVVAVSVSCPDPDRERGRLTLRQRERVASAGGYLSDDLELNTRLTITFGIRADAFSFHVADRLVTAVDPDDSGGRRLGAFSPVVGAVLRLGDNRSVYANFSTAFETPTVTELGNQPDGSAGLNTELDPQTSRTIETGLRGYSGHWLNYDIAVFRTGVRNELVPFEIPVSDGRRYFRNAGRTNRRGAEVAAAIARDDLALKVSYTLSDFRFSEYSIGDSSVGGTVIPGVPRHRAQTALRVGRRRFAIAEVDASSRVWANDGNTVSSRGFVVSNLRAGLLLRGFPQVTATVSLANILDTAYSPSLAVNAARGRYYEPGPRRTLILGVVVGARGR
ncbi:MAG: TonB-dependent receptor, partial [Gemmatimonadaceae bacterium]